MKFKEYIEELEEKGLSEEAKKVKALLFSN